MARGKKKKSKRRNSGSALADMPFWAKALMLLMLIWFLANQLSSGEITHQRRWWDSVSVTRVAVYPTSYWFTIATEALLVAYLLVLLVQDVSNRSPGDNDKG